MVSDEDFAKISAVLLGDNRDRAAAMPVDDILFVSPAAASSPGPHLQTGPLQYYV
jgi:hypothetical protein